MSQRAGQEPHDSVDDNHSGKLAAAHYVVAHAQFLGCKVLEDALVDALVASADEDETIEARETLRGALVEHSSLGAHHDDRRIGRRLQCANGLEERSGAHDHAGPAAEWGVVGRAMAVVGMGAQVVSGHSG